MLKKNRHYVKMLFTIAILCLYCIVLFTSMPGVNLNIYKSEDDFSIFMMSSLINGTKRNSILALNIAPILTLVFIRRLYSVLSRSLYPHRRILSLNKDVYSSLMYKKQFFLLFIISLLEAFMYLIPFMYNKNYIDSIPNLFSITYIYVLAMLVIGSFIVYLFIYAINAYGIGSGISCIVLANAIIALYNIWFVYLHQMPIYVLILITAQSMVSIYIFYHMDNTYIQIYCMQSNNVSKLLGNREASLLFSLDTMLGLTLLTALYSLLLYNIHISNIIYGLFLFYSVLIIFFVFVYGKIHKRFNNTHKYIHKINSNYLSIPNINKPTFMGSIFSIYLNNTYNMHIKHTILIVIVSLCTTLIVYSLNLLSIYTCSYTEQISFFYINHFFIFMFFLVFRSLFRIYKNSDICRL